MPLIRFRNFTAAARKPFMIPFGMYKAEAGSDLDVIEDADLITRLGISGVQNGVNTSFALSSAPQLAQILKNGKPLSRPAEYSISSSTLILAVPPTAKDILLAFDRNGLWVSDADGGGGGGGGGIGSIGDVYIQATPNQQNFNPGFPLTNPWVFLNGIKQRSGVDFTLSGGNVVMFATGLGTLPIPDIVEIIQ